MVGGSGGVHEHHASARRLFARSCVDWQYIFHPPLRVMVFQLNVRVLRHNVATHAHAYFFVLLAANEESLHLGLRCEWARVVFSSQ
jgi:hypothetical protein